ncbi:MAG: DUF2145 domain-containing protein [Comamonadaceae bacterium]|nr:DUF2145 domain-containing protein [Comamonadaceae bacterium]
MTPRADFAARTPSLRALWLTLVLAAAMVLAAPAARAGRSCEAHALTPQSVARGLQLAERTQQALDASGAQVVLLARAGQDLSRYGVRWSHLGIAYRQPDAASPGGSVWRVLHKLNQCGSAEAAVYRQGLGDFFLDDLWRFETAWVVPTPEVQKQLLALLQGGGSGTLSLHHKPYSIVSYAWSQTYQQSNQWAIETLALAMEPSIVAAPGEPVAASRQRAQAWLQFKGYAPAALTIGPLTRLGGRMTAANVAFDDHPNEKRFADRIETVTVDSVFTWMPRAGLGAAPVRLVLP